MCSAPHTLELARAAYNSGQFDRAIEFCKRGLNEAGASSGDLLGCRFRVLLSQCHWAQGDFKQALSFVELAEAQSASNVETTIRLLNQRGFVFTQTGEFAKAKAALKQAETLAETSQSGTLAAEVLCNIGVLQFYLGEYVALEHSARTVLAYAEREHVDSLMARACATLGKSFMYRKREAEAIPWFERALEIFAREGSAYYAKIMRSEIGCCYLALNEDDRAMACFAEALKISEAAGGLTSLHIDLANMGALHLRRGEYSAALSHFTKALGIARSLGDNISTAKWLHNIGLTYLGMDNPMLSKSYELQAELVNRKVVEARAAAAP